MLKDIEQIIGSESPKGAAFQVLVYLEKTIGLIGPGHLQAESDETIFAIALASDRGHEAGSEAA